MYYVYVLKSLKNGRLYIGQTDNVDRRLREHNAGQTLATRFQRPYQLLHIECFSARTFAVRRERFLKCGKGREQLKNLGLYSAQFNKP